MKKIIFMSFICSVFAFNAFAGTSNVSINCKSDSGRTVLTADVPGDESEAWVQLSIDGKSVIYLTPHLLERYKMNPPMGNPPEGKLSAIDTIDYLSLKTFAISVKDTSTTFPSRFLVLVANPETMKVTKENINRSAQFKAELTGRDPRGKNWLSKIVLNCDYDYSL